MMVLLLKQVEKLLKKRIPCYVTLSTEGSPCFNSMMIQEKRLKDPYYVVWVTGMVELCPAFMISIEAKRL